MMIYFSHLSSISLFCRCSFLNSKAWSAISLLAKFDVITNMAFLHTIVFPFPSVIRPYIKHITFIYTITSSNSCNNIVNMSLAICLANSVLPIPDEPRNKKTNGCSSSLLILNEDQLHVPLEFSMIQYYSIMLHNEKQIQIRMYLPSEGLIFRFRATFIQFEKPSLKSGSAPDFNKTAKCSYLLFDAATCIGAQPNKFNSSADPWFIIGYLNNFDILYCVHLIVGIIFSVVQDV
ncbi:hypothetical protein AGLY_000693 [Aphis glycines]|uniref:Uncharacterized protein n=1 Tax=Aphis glycines TaxID=307491 RepID=A0A6G0U8R1_APHGL|nr:hypothetical protein AGLY_000693 [Aphis glycines]